MTASPKKRQPSRRPFKPLGARGKEPIEELIYREILGAMADGRLLPGTKLVEDQVGAAFDVSRERARKVLHRLVHERRLHRIANRGVFVPQPTIAEARELYRARRILEAGIVTVVAGEIKPAGLKRLRDNIRRQKAAFAREDHAATVRLSGEFHFILADLLDSADVSRFIRELVGQTRLFMALFHPLPASDCTSSEHEALVAALAARDVTRAVKITHGHLRAVEARLRDTPSGLRPIDLRKALRSRD
jgi:DNA-binding GntR family transcriptional regulator